MDTNFNSARKFIQMKRQHNDESLSGPGSWKKNTRVVVKFINEAIEKYQIKSILDLGCGDWNWFNEIDMTDVCYTGWDADEQMIQDNQSKYGSDSINFCVKDIVTESLPDVDLIICRDVLFHIKLDLSVPLVRKIQKAGKYFVSTSFREEPANKDIRKYCDIENWGFYNINLNRSPFDLLGSEIDFSLETTSNNQNRYICLYGCR